MPQIIVLKPFKFAHRGVLVEDFEPHPEREPRDATQELVDHDGLVDEGYIELVGEQAPAPAPQPAAASPAAVPVDPEHEPEATANAPAPARKTAAKKAG